MKNTLKVLCFLKSQTDPLTVGEIAAACNLTKEQTKGALHGLAQRGKARRLYNLGFPAPHVKGKKDQQKWFVS